MDTYRYKLLEAVNGSGRNDKGCILNYSPKRNCEVSLKIILRRPAFHSAMSMEA